MFNEDADMLEEVAISLRSEVGFVIAYDGETGKLSISRNMPDEDILLLIENLLYEDKQSNFYRLT